MGPSALSPFPWLCSSTVDLRLLSQLQHTEPALQLSGLIARLARLFKQTSDTSEWLRRTGGELLGAGSEFRCLFCHCRVYTGTEPDDCSHTHASCGLARSQEEDFRSGSTSVQIGRTAAFACCNEALRSRNRCSLSAGNNLIVSRSRHTRSPSTPADVGRATHEGRLRLA